jgi:translation initiation factor 2B subunit (eIF-2B alpha/beta/delta family)
MPYRVSADERRRMIEKAAYFRAQRRAFGGGDAVHDWCEAEAEVDARLRANAHAECATRIEETLEIARKKLTSIRRKAASLSTAARAELQKDLDKLATLRDTLQPKLAELKERGERAGQTLREQAERMHDELAELVRALEAKAKR